MTVTELIEELKKYPGNMEVFTEHSESTCTGHGPDEYCYCGYKDVRESFYVCEEKCDIRGRLLKTPVITLKA